MPDMTMCASDECPNLEQCYRATAEPAKHQNFEDFLPKDGACESFIPVKGVTNEKD